MRCKWPSRLTGSVTLLLAAASAGGEVFCDNYEAYVRWQPHGAPPALSASSILVDDGMAYVSHDTLRIYNLADGDHPQLIGTLPGAEAVKDKVGDILICADNNTLNLIDVANPALPVLCGSLEGWLAQVAADGGLVVASYRNLSNDYLKVIDISDPAAPTLVAETFVTTKQASAIEIVGNLAYIAYPYSTGFLQPVDLSTPAAPALLAPYYNAAMDHHDLEMAPGRLYVVGKRTGEYTGRLQIMDVSSPSSPLILGEAVTRSYESCVLTVCGQRACVAYPDGNELTVLDLGTENEPRTITTLPTRFDPRGVAIGGDRAYLVGFPIGLDGGLQPSWLRILDITSAVAAPAIAELPLASRGDLVVANHLAYVIGSAGLIIVDLADPANPAVLSTTALGGALRGIAVSGALAYVLVDVAEDDVRLRVLDVGSPEAPVTLADFALPGSYSLDLALAGDRLCLALNEYDAYYEPYGHLAIVDVSTPSAPVLESDVVVAGYGQAEALVVAAGNQHVIVASSEWSPQIHVFDISDPTAPFLCEVAGIGPLFHGMELVGELLVVRTAASPWGMGDGILTILDAADPTQLVFRSTLRLAAPATGFAAGGGTPAGCFYAASEEGGISLCSAADPAAPVEQLTRNRSLLRLVDGGNCLVGLRSGFGLITVPYHGVATAAPPPPPARLDLAAQPNPFNPATTLHFQLARTGRVRLAIYDPSGRRVRTLLMEERPAGEHSVRWDGRDDAGKRQAGGLFLARLETAAGSRTAKLLLLK